MNEIFYECKALTSINLSNIDTSNSVYIYSMFYKCSSLSEINLSNFITSKVKRMDYLFMGCTNLTTLQISNFDTSKVEDMKYMFSDVYSLTSLNLINFNTQNVQNMKYMFNNCSFLINLDVSNFDVSQVTTMEYMFRGCSSLVSLDISNWNAIRNVQLNSFLQECSNLEYINMTNFITNNVGYMHNMFAGCSSLTYLGLSMFNTSNTISMKYKFDKCSKLVSLNLDNFDTSNCKTFEGLFQNCSSLLSLDLSHFITSQIENITFMFSGCYQLKYLNLSNWECSKISSMYKIFIDCYSLEEINLTNFKLLNVRALNNMFYNCHALISLDLSGFNTSQVTSMGYMFYGCNSLISLNISHFDTSNVRYIDNMFNGCSSLYSLDISNFNGKNLIYFNNMFERCNNLLYLNMKNFIEYNSTEIFDNNLYNEIKNSTKICIQKEKSKIITQLITEIGCTIIYNGEDLFILKKGYDIYENKCGYECNEIEFLFGAKNTLNFSIENYINTCRNELEKNIYQKCPSAPDGYYLDKNDLNYKLCYFSCKKCDKGGNELYHNCLECNFNYNYTYLLNSYKNCYINCSYYFYCDKNSSDCFCTENYTCPYDYNKYIQEKNECTDRCEKDNKYKFEFRKRCYEQCPKNISKQTNDLLTDNYYCEAICSEDYPFEILSTQQCEQNCQIELILTNKCILNFKENEYDINGKKIQSTKIQDIMLKNTEISFTSEEYNTSNLDKGDEEIIEDEKMKITLTTTKHQRNIFNNNNTIAIDIGDCETLLRETNNISDDELLYMRKIDVFQKEMQIPKIEFDIYYKENKIKLKKLNLSICENSNIYISYPVNISESLEILNPRSDYYNNICYPATSNKGIDITLTDRRNEFVKGNKAICQDGCYLEKYNNINKKSECSCKGKEFLSIINSISDIKINKKKLFENFIDINNIANIKLMKCYEILFSKEGIKNNIAFYSIIPIIIFHIISIFIFYIYQKKAIHNKINNIIYAIKNWNLVTNYEKNNNKKRNLAEILNQNELKVLKNKKIKFNQKGKNIINNHIIKNNILINNNEMSKDKYNQFNNKKQKLIKLKQPFDFYYS